MGTKRGLGCEATDQGTLVLTGEKARARLGIHVSPWVCIAVMLATLVFFRALAYALLRYDLRHAIDGAKEQGLSSNEGSDDAKKSATTNLGTVDAEALSC